MLDGMGTILIIGLVLGFLTGCGTIGRWRAFRKLGEYEFRQRWKNTKDVHRW
jgi:hypothetical protein